MFRKTFPVGALGCNCTIIADEESKQAIVVDPGDEAPRILAELQRHAFQVVAIVHTHAHIDHIGAMYELSRLTGAPTHLHPGDDFLHAILPQQAMFIGLDVPPPLGRIDHPLQDGGSISFGRYELGILHTPGHTPGSVCFTVGGADLCFSGDTLFAGGIGRTDLWGGDSDAIVKSIRERLYSLDGGVEVVPGHGPNTRIDRERHSNPFVRALR